MVKINITYDENYKVVGYTLIPLNKETAIEISEEDFKRLKRYLGEEI